MCCDYCEKHETTAKINGKIVEYDACSNKRYFRYGRKVFRYIGKGYVHSVGGVVQSFTEKDVMYFWAYR